MRPRVYRCAAPQTYKKDPSKPALAWDVHFWIGKDSTQDEYGTAAYKTVELDDYLNGSPVQHREIQGHESKLFLSYFPKFMVMNGGIDSGFHHTTAPSYKPRLLHIKGKKRCAARTRSALMSPTDRRSRVDVRAAVTCWCARCQCRGTR